MSGNKFLCQGRINLPDGAASIGLSCGITSLDLQSESQRFLDQIDQDAMRHAQYILAVHCDKFISNTNSPFA